MAKHINVHLLTWCKDLDQLYGSLLTLKSIRTGFPTANIFVFDNQSTPEAQELISEAGKKASATFIYVAPETSHWNWIVDVIRLAAKDDPCIILDPDLSFWESCEDWKFNGLVAGRLIPKFYCKYSNGYDMPRLHSSFLWIESPKRLLEKIIQTANAHPHFWPFYPFQVKTADEWVRYDTGAALYSAMPEDCQPFNEDQLNSFDHLFCGTHAKEILHKVPEWEGLLNHDLAALRGSWKRQEEFFKANA